METIQTINQQIYQLRTQGNYRQALDVYKNKVHQKFTKDQIIANDYLMANILHCIRKSSNPLKGLDYMQNHLKYFPDLQTHKQTCFEYGWSLYQHIKSIELNNTTDKVPDFMQNAMKLVNKQLAKQNYLLFSRLLLLISKKMMVKGEPVKSLDEFLDKFAESDFEGIAQKVKVKIKGKEKQVELASDKETYLVRKSKSLLLNQRFSECVKHSENTLKIIDHFHQGNQLWIARNLAAALSKTGRVKAGITKLRQVAETKKDWYLYHEVAQLYNQAENEKEALSWYCKAALRQGNTHYKTGLYENMCSFLSETAYTEKVCQHLHLANAIRKQQQWKIPAENHQLQVQHGCKSEVDQSVDQCYNDLTAWWQQHITDVPESEEMETGTITRILNDGSNGDGFITSEKGKSIYFRFKKCNIAHEQIKYGVKVYFKAESRTFKGKQVLNAMKVERNDKP